MSHAAPPDLNALALPELYAALAAGGLVDRLARLARDEDLGPDGVDVTTGALGAPDRRVAAELRARDACVVAGVAALPAVLDAFGGGVDVDAPIGDGRRAEAGATIARLVGEARVVLGAERTILNLLGRLSGVASRARAFVDRLRADAPDSRAVLLDTRKTTPGLRALEKYAVRCGGASLHRIGLHDAVLLKDNHLAGIAPSELAAFVEGVATRARASRPLRFVEVEVDALEQLDAVLEVPRGLVDIVLLDNMGPPELAEAVARRDRAGSSILLEASGGVTAETLGAIARAGVDRISVGSLTHGAGVVDLGLDTP